jgi:hypothetical protein
MKKETLPHNKPWRPVSVFLERYEYHPHIKSKDIPVTELLGQ